MPRAHFSLLSSLASACVLVAALCTSTTAHAQLRVSESVIDMHANDSLRTVDFHNDGAQEVHITLDLHRVVSPATSNPFNELTVPANAEYLTITPRVLRIPAMQSITAVVQRKVSGLDNDEVYRLNVKPIRKPDASPIVLNYDLLLLVRPKKASPVISLKRTSSGVALFNMGNSNALLSSMQLCDQSIDRCQPLTTQRLYAKQRWSVPVPEHFNVEHLVLHAEQTHQKNSEAFEYRASQFEYL